MKECFTQSAIIELEGKKSRKPGQKWSGLFTLSQINEDFTSRGIDSKDFTAN
jgi:hypothetical protein